MAHTQFTAEQLDHELRRRALSPPTSVQCFPDAVREEWVTATYLRAELQATPADHPERDWREWELALAEREALNRQLSKLPPSKFYRVVDR